MHSRRLPSFTITWILPLLLVIAGGCNTTKHLKEGQYLLHNNTIKLKTDMSVTRRGEFSSQLNSLIIQKTNTYLFGHYFPYKLLLYNAHYNKYQKSTSNYQVKSKTVEKPVIYDSTLERRSALNMKSFLFSQGYFYGIVRDTVIKKGKKADVVYKVETGINYLINKVTLDVNDSTILEILKDAQSETALTKGAAFSYVMLQDEMSRITDLLRDEGYYKFSQSNISFELDTVNKAFFKNAENPFESAINFIALQKQKKTKPTLDIRVIIRADDNPDAYAKYTIGKISVFPDFTSGTGAMRDSTLITKTVGNVNFRYHNYYVHENVIWRHIFLKTGEYFSQEKFNQTITKLNDLGVFQSVGVNLREDSSNPYVLRCFITMYPNVKHNIGTNFEVSSGSSYNLGSAISASYVDHNLAKGANMLTTTVSGGIETNYDATNQPEFFKRFELRSENFGVNVSLNMPKFVAPFYVKRTYKTNLPRTIFGIGYNLLDRQIYYTISNTTANLVYNWKQTQTRTWDFTPSFINIQQRPRTTSKFDSLLIGNDFLRNTYKENFIEGENVSFIFTNPDRSSKKGYSYIKLSGEEAGVLLSGINGINERATGHSIGTYAQYLKFDFDIRHFFNIRRSVAAVRFYGGVGIPYDKSTTLPYIKQYFVGGAYSIRGWSVRTLGPGATPPPADPTNTTVDITGDIKLEMNAEYRFPIVQLFAGSLQANGALFADAGNIWLARPSAQYPEGNFKLDRLGQDIAMSTGAGLRFDVAGLFVIRGDLAVKIKKPYVHENSGWVIHDISPFDASWRAENINYIIALGYPF